MLKTNSNTTLVKVKYTGNRLCLKIVYNSNTTLVKVKSKTYTCYYLPSIYSNTTLVKVKSKIKQLSVFKNRIFKYNTC